MSLTNEPCLARAIPMDLNPDEISYHPFLVNLKRCGGSCNTLDETKSVNFESNKIHKFGSI